MATQLSSPRTYASVGAVIVWLSLVLQFYVAVQNRIADVPETIIRFFSYFTVLTNMLIAICFTIVAAKGISEKGSFFTRTKVISAITVNIIIVGLTYNAILRFLWAPVGLARVADELLHSIIPVIFIIFWFKYVPKQNHQWKDILSWTIYPLVYLAYSLLRGPFAEWYPYPFIDVIKLGYAKVFLNSAMICAAFIFFALLLVGVAKMMSKRSA